MPSNRPLQLTLRCAPRMLAAVERQDVSQTRDMSVTTSYGEAWFTTSTSTAEVWLASLLRVIAEVESPSKWLTDARVYWQRQLEMANACGLLDLNLDAVLDDRATPAEMIALVDATAERLRDRGDELDTTFLNELGLIGQFSRPLPTSTFLSFGERVRHVLIEGTRRRGRQVHVESREVLHCPACATPMTPGSGRIARSRSADARSPDALWFIPKADPDGAEPTMIRGSTDCEMLACPECDMMVVIGNGLAHWSCDQCQVSVPAWGSACWSCGTARPESNHAG